MEVPILCLTDTSRNRVEIDTGRRSRASGFPPAHLSVNREHSIERAKGASEIGDHHQQPVAPTPGHCGKAVRGPSGNLVLICKRAAVRYLAIPSSPSFRSRGQLRPLGPDWLAPARQISVWPMAPRTGSQHSAEQQRCTGVPGASGNGSCIGAAPGKNGI